ncbi:MAG: hypothetical protein IKL44_05130 [Clostridia bacterium]|nr:hypothetical protein [Clostridia bacterium]
MAVKEYSYKKHKNIYCSAHTKVKEMRSKDGSDVVLVSEQLMSKIEELFSALRCSKYVITSGYRTPQYDIKVGGNGRGQHTLGKAVDARFYDQKGKIIPAKIVCCVAQDIGFTGIANISSAYKNVHLDTRSSGRYLGDEIYGTNSVTTDFYKYFGLTAADIEKYTDSRGQNLFARYGGNSVSIVSALRSLGEQSSYNYRAKIAKINGIEGYRGTAAQNTELLKMLKKGVLVKP